MESNADLSESDPKKNFCLPTCRQRRGPDRHVSYGMTTRRKMKDFHALLKRDIFFGQRLLISSEIFI